MYSDTSIHVKLSVNICIGYVNNALCHIGNLFFFSLIQLLLVHLLGALSNSVTTIEVKVFKVFKLCLYLSVFSRVGIGWADNQ